MLSKKMAVSLTSLITIFALAFVVPSALANKIEFDVTDASPYLSGIQVDHGAAGSTPVDITLKSAEPLLTAEVKAAVVVVGAVITTGNPPVPNIDAVPAGAVASKEFKITVTTPAVNTTVSAYVLAEALTSATTGEKDSTAASISFKYVAAADITAARTTAVASTRPRVVSIQRLRPGSQTVVAAFQEAEVTGPFDVRIVLTEKAYKPGKGDQINVDDIKVTNGTASNFTYGEAFARVGTPLSNPPTDAERAGTVLPHPLNGGYWHNNGGGSGIEDDSLAGVPRPDHADVTEAANADDLIPLPTGADDKYYQYRVTITPHRRANEVKVSVKEFHDNGSPFVDVYKPFDLDGKTDGREQLKLKVNIEKFDLEDGVRVYLPHQGKADFPKDGHYLLTRSKMGSHINYFKHEDASTPDRENKSKEQTPAQLLYNVRETTADVEEDRTPIADAPQIMLPNLEAFLANQGTIHLVSYVRDGANPKFKMGDLYISEVMWGTDASQADVADSNWIEIRNESGGKIDVGEQLWALWFYEAHETPPTAYDAGSAYEGPTGQAGEIIDVIGTKASDTGLSWSIAGIGQSGRSGIDRARAEQQVLTPTTPLISMYRVMKADGTLSDGTQKVNWMQTPGPSVNLKPGRENAIIATPGAAPFDTPDTLQAEKDKQKAKEDQAKADQEKIANTGTYPKAGQGRVYISEVMFAGGGTLPQWIEISNGDRSTEFNLSGWTLTVDNAATDADVDVASATFTIPNGTTIDPSAQNDTPSTILVVTEQGRNNLTGAKASGQVINLAKANEVELITAGVLSGKYTLLSDMAFQITLAPPVPKATKAPAGETAAAKATRTANDKKEAALRKAATDMVGNLGKDGAAAWALPMTEEGGRSSIIRKHVQVVRGPAAPEDGMMENNWALASDTAFADVTHIRAQSYYGAANDIGTPGFRAGGALPVELSHFRPARDKATGQVVITWATQSELNNAGFFIKRAQQRNGEFKVINATMVPGAGTTSEKQFYTYTDTTAQPNVVYYYQIEDVSLDGNRQTLTRGIRLKGHIGAAGKATTLWGELKSANE